MLATASVEALSRHPGGDGDVQFCLTAMSRASSTGQQVDMIADAGRDVEALPPAHRSRWRLMHAVSRQPQICKPYSASD